MLEAYMFREGLVVKQMDPDPVLEVEYPAPKFGN